MNNRMVSARIIDVKTAGQCYEQKLEIDFLPVLLL